MAVLLAVLEAARVRRSIVRRAVSRAPLREELRRALGPRLGFLVVQSRASLSALEPLTAEVDRMMETERRLCHRPRDFLRQLADENLRVEVDFVREEIARVSVGLAELETRDHDTLERLGCSFVDGFELPALEWVTDAHTAHCRDRRKELEQLQRALVQIRSRLALLQYGLSRPALPASAYR